MALSLDVYRLDGANPIPIPPSGMDEELRLQEILASRIEIVDPDLLLIGREVHTAWDSRIDLLAIDSAGGLVVVELKRDRTPRDVVAQILEYGSWVRGLDNAEIAKTFRRYLERYRPGDKRQSLDQEFRNKFNIEIPDELNTAHRLIIVAAELDAGTERIVDYLTEEHSVPVNAVFFRVFKDAGNEYLTRAWMREPEESAGGIKPGPAEWNGEFYANFGHGEHRDWEVARTFGLVSAGGGNRYTGPLNLLEKDARVWVKVPSAGFVGVGIVTGEPTKVNQLTFDGVPFRSHPGCERYGLAEGEQDSEYTEVAVTVQWIHTVSIAEAVQEKGFYGNQWTVTQSRDPKWDHTIARLKTIWGIS